MSRKPETSLSGGVGKLNLSTVCEYPPLPNKRLGGMVEVEQE